MAEATPPVVIVPGTPAHDAAMVAKVDAAAAASAAAVTPTPIVGAPAVVPDVAVRPAHIPEKFWDAGKGEVNVEALAKSYTELEKGKGTPAPVVPGTPAPVVVEGKPDMAALSAEFAGAGALSEASYAALAAAGLDKGTVDTYIEGQKALAATRDNAGFELAGGKDQFTAMSAWAASSMTAEDITVLNAGLAGNAAQMKQAVTSLKAQYEAANGREPTLVKGGATSGTGTDAAFASRAEVTAAMRDPRYKADPAYRASVERRVGAMQVF